MIRFVVRLNGFGIRFIRFKLYGLKDLLVFFKNGFIKCLRGWEFDLLDQRIYLSNEFCVKVGSLAVKELCFVKDDVFSRDNLSGVRDLDPVDICGVISNKVTDLSSRIKLVPSVPLKLGILCHRVRSVSIGFNVC